MKKKNKKNIFIKRFLADWILKNDKKYDTIQTGGFILFSKNKRDYKKVYKPKKEENKEMEFKGSSVFMCKASEIGKIVVNKCLERQLDVNTQKLQKLLVLIQIECIKKSGLPFFKDT